MATFLKPVFLKNSAVNTVLPRVTCRFKMQETLKYRETFLKPVVLDKFSYETHKNASDKIQNSTPVLHVKIQREI